MNYYYGLKFAARAICKPYSQSIFDLLLTVKNSEDILLMSFLMTRRKIEQRAIVWLYSLAGNLIQKFIDLHS